MRDLYQEGRAEFAEMVADMIRRERIGGHAVEGPDASALARVLLDLNDHAVERHATGTGPAREDHIDALTHLWTSSIYGSTR